MKQLTPKKFIKLFKKLLGMFPVSLPTGMTQIEVFTKDILYTYDVPDMPSYHHAVATMIMHLPPTKHKASKHYFAKSLKKAQANQTAYEVIQKIKEAEKAEKDAKDVTNVQEQPLQG